VHSHFDRARPHHAAGIRTQRHIVTEQFLGDRHNHGLLHEALERLALMQESASIAVLDLLVAC
jgi:hypothetical protein